jgi:hypothetical protein
MLTPLTLNKKYRKVFVDNWLRRRARKIARVLKTFLESASLIGLLLYSIWSRL